MSTGNLEKFLRNQERKNADRKARATVAGIGPGGWDSKALANAQGQAPADGDLLKTKTQYRVYVENVFAQANLTEIIGRYFAGASIFQAIGLDARTQSANEYALVVEIITTLPDSLQRIANLAQDLRTVGKQISVLVSRATVETFEVTEHV